MKQKLQKEKKQKLPKKIKQKLPKEPKAPKIKKQKLPKIKKPKVKKVKAVKAKKIRTRSEKINIAKTVAVIVLAVAVVAQSVLLAVMKMKTPSDTDTAGSESTQFVLNVDLSGVANTALDDIAGTAKDAITEIKDGVMPNLDVTGMVTKIVYSDAIVNTVMSMSFPLLKTVLTDLGMMDFAENVSLYPTPERLAPLFEAKGYSCCTKSGERKTLQDVLIEAGDDWTYFDTKITLSDGNGGTKEDTIWNSIVWGVTGKDSFYSAMNDMSEGLRGVLEICMQGIDKTVTINLVEFLLKKDFADISLDAARIYNGSGKGGYELCLIPLFNMLGLRDGDYDTPETFASYTSLGDMWKAILEPVLGSIDKIMDDPVQKLCDMLVNFADAVDSGALVEEMKTLRMDAEFNDLAKTFMGYEDGLLFNLGEALVDIIKSMGIDLGSSFNGILDSLLQTVLKNPSADMPDMDVDRLKSCATQSTLSNGNKVWTANSEQVVDYLVEYAIQGRTVEIVLSQTPLAETPEAQKIVSAIDSSKDGVTELVNVVLDIALQKLQ